MLKKRNIEKGSVKKKKEGFKINLQSIVLFLPANNPTLKLNFKSKDFLQLGLVRPYVHM